MTTPPTSTKEQLPRWDLSEYYTGIDDPNIDQDLADDLAFAVQFEQQYKGKITDLSADELAAAIGEYESNSQRPRSPGLYVALMKSIDENDPDVAALQTKIREKSNKTGKHMMFFGLELKNLDPDKLEKMYDESEALARYRPFLKSVLKGKPHTLSDEVEMALQARAPASPSATLNRLYAETQAELRYPFPDDLLEDGDLEKFSAREGDKKQDGISMLTRTELGKYSSSHNEAARKAAYESSAGVTNENTYMPAFIMNHLIGAKQIEDRERGYADPAASRHLSNDVETDVVDTMVSTVKANYPKISHRFLKLKAGMFGGDTLKPWNTYAPLPDESETKISWQEAKDIVLESFREFSPRSAAIVQKFFDEGWIDAEPREGKRGGAFSMPNRAASHPFVMVNFQGRLDDVMTLAHELGHGVHQYLAAQKQGDLMDGTSLTFAETASTFAETMVFNKLLDRITDPKERKALLASKIADSLGTTAVQVSFHDFETKIHAERQNGEIKPERFAEIWNECVNERVGDAIEEHESNKGHSWGGIPHFFRTPFYVYSYSFGELLATSLYQQFEEMKAQGKGAEFEDKYIDLLSAASTEHHSEMLPKRFGEKFDLTKAEFWQGGLDVYSKMIDDLEQAIADEKAAPNVSVSGTGASAATVNPAPDKDQSV